MTSFTTIQKKTAEIHNPNLHAEFCLHRAKFKETTFNSIDEASSNLSGPKTKQRNDVTTL